MMIEEDREASLLEIQQWLACETIDSTKEKQREPGLGFYPRVDIYLTWILDLHGNTTLRAISTSCKHARLVRQLLRDRGSLIRVWTEKSVTNHVFALTEELQDDTND